MSSIRRLWALAVALRVALLLWGEFQDRTFAVKYTDVDYVVFSDAARFMAAGASPYQRLTYRYTPLLAALLTPNVFLGDIWGKSLFALCDCTVGFMLLRILHPHPLALPLASTWLINPIVINVSTRGNAEGFVAIWAVASLYAFTRSRYTAAAILLGIATHVKLYPVVYGVPMALFLLRRGQSTSQDSLSVLAPFMQRLRCAMTFAAVSAAAFSLLTGACYLIYGYPFLFEAYIYHFGRFDVRHNFAPHFFPMYLDVTSAAAFGKSAFLPQAAAVVAAGVALSSDVPFALFIQTLVFVALNKVYTVQYFVWFFSFLPLALSRLPLHAKPRPFFLIPSLVVAVALWAAAQGSWLHQAYHLEFKGDAVHYSVWACGLALLAAHTVLALVFLFWYRGTSRGSREKL